MAIFKCKMCGGGLEVNGDSSVVTCDYCGSVQTLPKKNDDVIANLFNRANNLRIKCEFDKASEVYEKIINEDNTEAEAHWGLVLCKYGIEYVEDPKTYKRIPTCHRTQYESVLTDVDYLAAIENADSASKSVYQAQAEAISALQKDILAIVKNEKPFDVFICYKETDENGKRTVDSALANDIYYQLTQEGLNVFYAAITLEDKLGQEYEPYIFAALNSAKVMLVVGTKPEYFGAVWVKNEWARFLKIMKTDRSKLLIPCYRDMDAYDLPEEFSHLQAQDMSKIGFVNDVVRGIKKVVAEPEKKETVTEKVVVSSPSNSSTAPLLERAFMFLEDGDWQSADEYCEKVLDLDPKCAEAYLGKLMAEFRVEKKEKLSAVRFLLDANKNYQKTVQFADSEMADFLKRILEKKSIIEKTRGLLFEMNDNPAVLKNDGTIITLAKLKGAIIAKCSLWGEKNIMATSASRKHVAFLLEDGTVAVTGANNYYQCEVSKWKDITAISAGAAHTVGLKKDGKVVVAGDLEYDQYSVARWKDIVAVSAGSYHLVGLKRDGTVVAVGDDAANKCNVKKWTDIVAISAGMSHTVGLKKDGTLIATGDNHYGQCDISEWNDIIAVYTGDNTTVGLRKDGTVVGTGVGFISVMSRWEDIIAASPLAFGLKTDGTLAFFEDVKNLKLFNDIENLENEIIEENKKRRATERENLRNLIKEYELSATFENLQKILVFFSGFIFTNGIVFPKELVSKKQEEMSALEMEEYYNSALTFFESTGEKNLLKSPIEKCRQKVEELTKEKELKEKIERIQKEYEIEKSKIKQNLISLSEEKEAVLTIRNLLESDVLKEVPILEKEVLDLQREFNSLGFFAKKRKNEITSRINELTEKLKIIKPKYDSIKRRCCGYSTIKEVDKLIEEISKKMEAQQKLLEEKEHKESQLIEEIS